MEGSAADWRPPSALLTSFALAFGAAAAGGVATYPAVRPGSWYDRLDKPPWTPPKRAFGPVWSVLYASQAVAAWLVWRRGGRSAAPALGLYGAQLMLNLAWSLLFFGQRRIGAALVDVAILWVAIAATIAGFRRHSTTAAALLLPYLAWVTLATALNGSILRRNRQR